MAINLLSILTGWKIRNHAFFVPEKSGNLTGCEKLVLLLCITLFRILSGMQVSDISQYISAFHETSQESSRIALGSNDTDWRREDRERNQHNKILLSSRYPRVCRDRPPPARAYRSRTWENHAPVHLNSFIAAVEPSCGKNFPGIVLLLGKL